MARSATSVQLVPSNDSVSALFIPGGVERPAKAKASVELPELAKLCLAVFKLAVSVQDVPS